MKKIVLIIPFLLFSCTSIDIIFTPKHTKEVVINEVVSKNSKLYDSLGGSSDWIELYNAGSKENNLKDYILEINNKVYKLPEYSLNPQEYLLIRLSGKRFKNTREIHIPTKIKSEGSSIKLCHPKGFILNEITVPQLGSNESYGLDMDGNYNILSDSTPYGYNWSDKKLNNKRSSKLSFSHESGFYKKSIVVEIKKGSEEEAVYYTTDGSDPTLESELYTGPLEIRERTDEEDILSDYSNISETFKGSRVNSFKGTLLKAVSHIPGRPLGKVKMATYFISPEGKKRYSFPVISLSTDSENLFNHKRGIYVLGEINREWKEKNPNGKIQGDNPANFTGKGKGWSVPFKMEFFSENGEYKFNTSGDMRIFGGWSRANSQKSLRLDFKKPLEERVFNNQDGGELDSLILRNSGTDWSFTMFRDSFMTSMVEDIVETQRSRAALVFINGEYWGIHNIRERINQEYIGRRFNKNSEDIVILESNSYIKDGVKGDEKDYKEIIKFAEENSLSLDENYNIIKNRIDVDNYIDYTSSQVFWGNTDWPGNNIRYWRDKEMNSKWRWILFDTDFGYGLNIWAQGVRNNTFALLMDENGEPWPNPPWSTTLFRNLMDNGEFKRDFLNRLCDFMNTRFSNEVVQKRLDSFESRYEKEIDEHINKWPDSLGNKSMWQKNIKVMRSFSEERKNILLTYINRDLNLGGYHDIHFKNVSGGVININSIKGIRGEWSGTYLSNTLSVEAIPDEGYSFEGWNGLDSGSSVINIELNNKMEISPIFKKRV